MSPNDVQEADGERKRVTVIGAGIVGVCCALYLQREGWNVTLVDPRPPGEGCSAGNAGVIVNGAVPPPAKPGILWEVPRMLLDPMGPLAVRWRYLPQLLPWLVRFARASSEAKIEATTAALATLIRQIPESYRLLVAGSGADRLMHDRGVLILYETEEGLEKARPSFERRRRHGSPMEEVGPYDIRRIEPALAPIFKGGWYRSEGFYVDDPLRFTQVLAEDFRRHGGALRIATAHGIEMGAGRPRKVRTDAGELDTDLVVIAAGAWSRKLTRAIGVDIPLDTERGYHVMLPNSGIEVRLPLSSGEGGFFITPMADGLRLAGTVELGGLTALPNYARARVMLDRARRFFPALNDEGARFWMGFRPSLPDSKPVISGISGKPGVFLAFGHGHLGLSLAAVTGKAIADMAVGRPTVVDMTPFHADRF